MINWAHSFLLYGEPLVESPGPESTVDVTEDKDPVAAKEQDNK